MQRGNPRFTLRLPSSVIAALKQLAQARNTTPSDILRDLLINELTRAGYSIEPTEGENTSA